ncbi:MAG: PQQ-dependent sugar dehydrogenase [Campylobacterales bacterium]
MKPIIVAMMIFTTLLFGQIDDKNIKTEQITTIDGVPWALEFIDDKNLLITQKSGKIYRLNIDTKELIEIKNPPKSLDYGQGGLMDIALSPEFTKTKEIYLTYTKDSKKGAFTTLAKAKLIDDRLVGLEDIIETKSISNTGRHFGSRIAFDKDGGILFGIGDRGVRENGQNLKTHAGSLLKVTHEGKPHKDNPFINSDSTLKEIYSYGHRNPQGVVYDSENDIIYLVEHGPRGGDEINIIQKGGNYGWPLYSYGKEYYADIEVGDRPHKNQTVEPVKIYDPSIAPSSMYLYRDGVFEEFDNSLLIGALAKRHLNIIKLDSSGKPAEELRILENLNERIRDVIADSKGYIYISTDSGKIIRLLPRQ